MKIKIFFLTIALIYCNVSLYAIDEKLKANGITSFFKRNYTKAVDNFTKILAQGDTTYEVLYYRGLSYLYLNDFEKALTDFNNAFRFGKESSDLYNNRGLAYLYIGELKLAFDDFNKAIELDSNFAEAYTNRATIHIELGELDEAFQDLNKALKLNPDNVSAIYERGRLNYKMKKYTDAIKDFDKCIKLNLKNSKVYYNRGNAYFKLEQYQKAIEDYTKCLALDSTDTEALNNRAVAYDKIGKKELANQDRKRLAKFFGNQSIIIPIEEINFIKFTDSLNYFSVNIPSNWKIFQKIGTDFEEVLITPENIKSDTDFYYVGIRLSFNWNMSKNYNAKTSGEIIEFWRGSVEKNANNYYNYRYLQQKLFNRGEYSGNMFETLVQYWQNSPLLQCYELALAKEDILFFGFFQAPSVQFNYFRQVFDKIIESLVLFK
jgi:tetratricopeptide (TPR) repeat protein